MKLIFLLYRTITILSSPLSNPGVRSNKDTSVKVSVMDVKIEKNVLAIVSCYVARTQCNWALSKVNTIGLLGFKVCINNLFSFIESFNYLFFHFIKCCKTIKPHWWVCHLVVCKFTQCREWKVHHVPKNLMTTCKESGNDTYTIMYVDTLLFTSYYCTYLSFIYC